MYIKKLLICQFPHVIKIHTNLQGYIFCVLQHFASKSRNFCDFDNFFSDISFASGIILVYLHSTRKCLLRRVFKLFFAIFSYLISDSNKTIRLQLFPLDFYEMIADSGLARVRIVNYSQINIFFVSRPSRADISVFECAKCHTPTKNRYQTWLSILIDRRLPIKYEYERLKQICLKKV